MKDFVISVRIPESFLKLEFLVGGAPIYLPVIGLILKFKKAADINKMVKDSEAVLADAKKEYEETGALFKCEEQMQSGTIPDNYFPLDASEATPFR